jgi:hypothetical protein
MEPILYVFAEAVGWLVMKKDCDLPWIVRLARWAALLLGALLGGGYTVHSYMEWFL